MNNRTFMILCSVSLVLLFGSFGLAQPPDNQWGVGARFSYFSPESTDVPSGGKFEPDESVLFEGNVTWFPLDMFSLEFAVGYTESTGNLNEPGLNIEFLDIEQIPLLLTARYHWWIRNSTMSIYGGGGIGYYLNDASPTAAAKAAAPGLSFDTDDSFGYHLAGGFEWFFTERWGLNIDLKYIWNEFDSTVTDPADPPPEKTTIDFNTLVIGLGIKYYF